MAEERKTQTEAEVLVEGERAAEGGEAEPQSLLGGPNSGGNESEGGLQRMVENGFVGLGLNEAAVEFCRTTSRNTDNPDFQWKKDETVLTLTFLPPKADK